MLVEYRCMAGDCGEEALIEFKDFKPFIRCPTCRSVMQITNIEQYYTNIKDPRLRETHIRYDMSRIARCRFAYDCILHGCYETDCENETWLKDKCLVQFDTQLARIYSMLEKILTRLEK